MRAARAGTIGVLLLPAARAGTISVLSPAAGAQSGARCVNVAQVGAVAVAIRGSKKTLHCPLVATLPRSRQHGAVAAGKRFGGSQRGNQLRRFTAEAVYS